MMAAPPPTACIPRISASGPAWAGGDLCRTPAGRSAQPQNRPICTRQHRSRRRSSAALNRRAPRPGEPQDWRHHIMPKGFVSERDLNPRARDLRICATAWPWRKTTAGQRHGSGVRGPTCTLRTWST